MRGGNPATYSDSRTKFSEMWRPFTIPSLNVFVMTRVPRRAKYCCWLAPWRFPVAHRMGSLLVNATLVLRDTCTYGPQPRRAPDLRCGSSDTSIRDSLYFLTGLRLDGRSAMCHIPHVRLEFPGRHLLRLRFLGCAKVVTPSPSHASQLDALIDLEVWLYRCRRAGEMRVAGRFHESSQQFSR
jgi:hypothetical protein